MMKIHPAHLSALLLALLALAGPVQAKTAAKAPDPGPPPADAQSAPLDAPSPDAISTLRIFKNNGAEVHYLGRMFGLDGWLISKDQNMQVVYTTLDGQGTVVGVLYGPDGSKETSKQLAAAQQSGLAIPGISPTGEVAGTPAAAPAAGDSGQGPPSERLMHDVETSTYLKFGPDDAPILYVFADPRCHFCHDYWDTLTTQFLPQNHLQLRIIPVAILGADSVTEAEGIISSPNPSDLWAQVENGILAGLPSTMAADAAMKIQTNNNIMVRWKMSGTPYSVYRGKDGKVKVVYAVPSDVAQVVADLGK
jgi:thiol:disulfide interchange protein DsbG